MPSISDVTPADSAPAGGAELAQVVGATGAALLLMAALFYFGLGHRSGRVALLGRAAAIAERFSGLPGWAALPAGLATVSLLSAVFGLYWDISLHIDNGRDAGPLANPSHYFILAGLFGIFSAGWLAMVLPERKPGPAAIRLRRDWHVPVSGVIFMACASFALAGFPLDDLSHRLFGQDVTLWGPTHLMMLGGAAMTLVGILAILVEARLAQRDRAFVPAVVVDLPAVAAAALERLGPILTGPRMRTARYIAACGGLLIGLSIFQGEFDFGVPQFRLLYHPVLIALAAGVALVAVRTLAGRGAAFGAVAFFILVRGVLTLWVDPIAGETTPHFPLYAAEAAIVEAVALLVPPDRGYRFGAVSGALIGSLGVVAEWGWSHVWMPIAWPGHIVPEAVLLSVPVGAAAGVLGAFLGSALRLRPLAARPRAWRAPAASLLVIAGVLAYLLPTSVPEGATGAVVLAETSPAPGREAHATLRVRPAGLAEDADWLTTIAWQGQEPLRVDPLEKVADGVYRTTAPLPVDGTWKSALRLHRGDTLASIPVYLPADPAIPAAEVAAPARFERPFAEDREILQRERKDDVPGWLWGMSGLVVLGSGSALLALLGWSLIRLARAGAGVATPMPPPRPHSERPGVGHIGLTAGRSVPGHR